jgi:hypothetical protein
VYLSPVSLSTSSAEPRWEKKILYQEGGNMKYEFSYQILCISQTVFLFSFSFVLFHPFFPGTNSSFGGTGEGVCAMRLAVGVLTAWLAAAAAFAPTAPVASNMRLRGA